MVPTKPNFAYTETPRNHLTYQPLLANRVCVSVCVRGEVVEQCCGVPALKSSEKYTLSSPQITQITVLLHLLSE